MSKVAIFGAGYTVKPMVDYFIDRCKYEVVVATRTVSKAEKVIEGRPLGTAISWTSDQVDLLETIIKDIDIVVLMIPRSVHHIVSKMCLKYCKPLITTDFMHPDIISFHEEAKKQNILFLTELGESPGLDNMCSKQMIDLVKADGGKVISLISYGSGIPSFEHNRTPFGYKFSWDPKGLMRSAVKPAVYQIEGKKIVAKIKFEDHKLVDIDGIGTFEVYPNDDSTRYIPYFELDSNVSIIRGLLRYLGYCNTITSLLKLKLIENTIETDVENTTYSQFMSRLVGVKTTDKIRSDVANFLNIDTNDDIIKRLNWLGLFDDVQIPLKRGTNTDILVDLMLKKMSYAPHEKDMIIVHNEIVAEFPDRKEKRISSMLVEGIPNGDTAMARAVSLPPAIAAKLILEDKIKAKGVCMPTTKEMYEPILKEMETFGFSFKKKTIIL